VIRDLEAFNIPHYDFRDSQKGSYVFKWDMIKPNSPEWTFQEYKEALHSDHADKGFNSDFGAMNNATGCLLVMPCNRSAHLELGWCVGVGLPTAIYFPPNTYSEPELMYKMCNIVTDDLRDALEALGVL
jgi:hypothetical protein